MLPLLVDKPLHGEATLHEIKFDRYRRQLVIDAGRIRAFTRNGY